MVFQVQGRNQTENLPSQIKRKLNIAAEYLRLELI
jgi:hypothetical protein